MYAVIQTGGKQYRVRAGDVIVVEKLDGDVGAEISFENVLMVGGGEKGVSLGSALKGAAVTATLIETRKGEKVKVFKKIRRQGYRRTQGHRQFESVLRITGFSGGGEKAKWDGEVDLTPRSVLVARARGLAPMETAEPAAKPAKAAKASTPQTAAPKAAAPKAAAPKPAKAEVEAPVAEAAMMDTPVSEQVAEKPATKAKASKVEAAPAAEKAPAKAKAEPKAKPEPKVEAGAKAPAAKAKAEPKAEAAPKKAAAPKAAADTKAKAPAKAKPAPKAGK